MLSSLLGVVSNGFFDGEVCWGRAGCCSNIGAGADGVGFFDMRGGLIGRLAAGLDVGVMARVTRELVALASKCIVSRSFSTFSRCVC